MSGEAQPLTVSAFIGETIASEQNESSNSTVRELQTGLTTMEEYLNENEGQLSRKRKQNDDSDSEGNAEPSEVVASTEHKKPSYTYSSLIGQALLASPNKKLPLNEIYLWISRTYPFYSMTKKGWQNSIRHNLTLCPAFHKMERDDGVTGKGSFWTIPDEYEKCFVNGIYKNDKPKEARKAKRAKTTNDLSADNLTPNNSVMQIQTANNVSISNSCQNTSQSHEERSAFDPIIWPSQALNLISSPTKLSSQNDQPVSTPMSQTQNGQLTSVGNSISPYLASIFNNANLLSQPTSGASELASQSGTPDALQFLTETAALIFDDEQSSSGSISFEQGTTPFNPIPHDQADSEFPDLSLNAESMILFDLTHGNPTDVSLAESTRDEPSGANSELQFLSTQYDTALGDSICSSLMMQNPDVSALIDEQFNIQEDDQLLNTSADLNSICDLALNGSINNLNPGIDFHQSIPVDNNKNDYMSPFASDGNGFSCSLSKTYRECRDLSKLGSSERSIKSIKKSPQSRNKRIRDTAKISVKTYKVIMDLLSKMPESDSKPKSVIPMKDWVYESPSYCVNMRDVEFAYLEITKDIEQKFQSDFRAEAKCQEFGVEMMHFYSEDPLLDYNQGRFFLSSLNSPEIADIPDFCYTKYMDPEKLTQVDLDTRDLNYVDQGVYNFW
ncbi:2039_t:CDS:2 [Acaulospora colombiana]|uniref:2039_t:CDS:1 n=1 Tax=Acaulospora colombiana TaxID=27376 RepID=A0ACA9NJQ7_9GLOM|nr:2039_t:CDS:2 [Acaulospora colombiana]